jgi:DNA-binding transcriptional ArsR family regulator
MPANAFITNSNSRTLKKRLAELIQPHKELKFLVGYFYFSGWRELYESLKSQNDLTKITRLLDEVKEQVKLENKKIYSADLVEALFTYPVITPTKLASQLNKHYTTTSKYLAQLTEMGILKEAVVGKYHLFANHKLLKILSK